MRCARWAVVAGGVALLIPTSVPAGDLREQIVEHIDSAQSSIDVVVYEIRSNDVAGALIEAKHRGVRVRVIVDSVHSPTASVQEQAIADEGIPVKRVGGVGRKLLHDKFIVFDGKIASTPSYNRSAVSLRAPEGESEGFTHERHLVARLQGEFNDVWKSSSFQDSPQN